MNTLFDQPGGKLRRREPCSDFGNTAAVDAHVQRPQREAIRPAQVSPEIETQVENGEAMARIIEAAVFSPSFRYEKFRSEWADSTGHVVIDETPIGNFGEIEGPAKWIDSTARRLRSQSRII